jgi:hypothetical protein
MGVCGVRGSARPQSGHCRRISSYEAILGVLLYAAGVAMLGAPQACRAQENRAGGDLFLSTIEESKTFLTDRSADRTEPLFATASVDGGTLGHKKIGLDLSPLINQLTSYIRGYGIPLREYRDASGKKPVAVSVSFSVRDNLPPVNIQLGDRTLEPFGAFYASHKGARWAVVWPIDHFSLRLEGGEDSEFGYYGIAGMQWTHPTRPLACGFGVPINLHNADGAVGVIFQFRMKLN